MAEPEVLEHGREPDAGAQVLGIRCHHGDRLGRRAGPEVVDHGFMPRPRP